MILFHLRIENPRTLASLQNSTVTSPLNITVTSVNLDLNKVQNVKDFFCVFHLEVEYPVNIRKLNGFPFSITYNKIRKLNESP